MVRKMRDVLNPTLLSIQSQDSRQEISGDPENTHLMKLSEKRRERVATSRTASLAVEKN